MLHFFARTAKFMRSGEIFARTAKTVSQVVQLADLDLTHRQPV